MSATFFAGASELRDWLRENHHRSSELWIGFHRKGSGQAGLTYQDALDEALCFGWIDGVRKRIDDRCYMIRFTPRRPGSVWSAVNVARAGELRAAGRMEPAGLRAFEARDPAKDRQYSYEAGPRELHPAYLERFRANGAAWEFFSAQPPYYRRTAVFWVMSAKKEETRQKRLATLIGDSAAGRRIDLLAPGPKK